MPTVEGSGAFAADGNGPIGRVGVLLSHGFTGTPSSMRPWAEQLAAAGLTVRLPLLPGHGSRWQDLNATRWPDWYAEICRSHDELTRRCDQIVCCGLSMGATLVSLLAADRGDRISGLVLVNPSFGTLRRDAKLARYLAWAVRSTPGIAGDIKKPDVREPGYDRLPLRAFVSLQDLWRRMLPELPKVTAPILCYRSTEDHVVDRLSGELLRSGASSTTVTEVELANSYHVATLDYDAQTIFDGSLAFIRQVTGVPDVTRAAGSAARS